MDPITIALLIAGGFLLKGAASTTNEITQSVTRQAADAALNAPVLHLSTLQLAAFVAAFFWYRHQHKGS